MTDNLQVSPSEEKPQENITQVIREGSPQALPIKKKWSPLQGKRGKGKLTRKEKIYISSLVHGSTPAQAAHDAYDIDPNNTRTAHQKDRIAQAMGIETLKRPHVQKGIVQLLNEQGIPLTRLNSKLSSLLDSHRTVVLDKQLHEVPDNNTQLEALKTGYKLHGHLVADKPLIDNRQVHVTMSDPSVMQRLVDSIEALNRKLNDSSPSLGEIS